MMNNLRKLKIIYNAYRIIFKIVTMNTTDININAMIINFVS